MTTAPPSLPVPPRTTPQDHLDAAEEWMERAAAALADESVDVEMALAFAVTHAHIARAQVSLAAARMRP